jgi:predicted ATPase/transcriptional regulator with XRE-family HTH domain
MMADVPHEPPSFAELLRRRRLAAGLTQEALAARAGISTRAVSDLERGLHAVPRRDTLVLLCDALGLAGAERAAFAAAARRVARPRSTSGARPERDVPPVPLTPLIGRQSERSVVGALLRDSSARLVTLTGPGGVGKTRLALAVTAQMSDAFPDGQVFVDLAPVRDPDLVLAHLATALGVREAAGRGLADAVHEFVRRRGMLLVLDNVEHLLPAAPVVAELLAAGSQLNVLVTSRAPLRVRGEHEFAVPPLPVPMEAERHDLADLAANEAVALFVARVQAVRPGFALTADNAAAVANICRSLDGLPLALELAAARAKILPMPTLLTRLGVRLPLLTGGTRDAPERQRTLRHAIAWSHDLLDAHARVLFHRLGVFFGGWTLEAAETVANLDGALDVLDGLAALADLSLVRLEDSGFEPRYRMLETIREFAQERLAASGEQAALWQAHATYFLELAEQTNLHLSGPGQRGRLRRLETELPNFRAALDTLDAGGDHEVHLRLAGSLGDLWWMCSHLAEGRAYLERALARDHAPTPPRAKALKEIGRIAASQGDLIAGEIWLQQSEVLARALAAPTLHWQALFEYGQVVEYAGDIERAVSLYELALAVARELDDPQAVSVALWALGEAAYGRGDVASAECCNEEAIELIRLAGDEFMLSLCLTTRGAIALAWDDAPRAAAAYGEALDLTLGLEMHWATSAACAGFAALAAGRAAYIDAATLLGAAETIREASHQMRMANFYHHAKTTQAVRAALGEDDFAAAWEAGRSLPDEDAATLPPILRLLQDHDPRPV